MENIIKLVTEKAGISEAQATTAVQTVIGFLKAKMPGGIGTQVETFLQGDGGLGSMGEGLKDKMGGMFK